MITEMITVSKMITEMITVSKMITEKITVSRMVTEKVVIARMATEQIMIVRTTTKRECVDLHTRTTAISRTMRNASMKASNNIICSCCIRV